MRIQGKSQVQVVIGGKVFTIGGYDDEIHIQRVASTVNRKLEEFEETDSYRGLPADMKPLLIEINLADELVKSQDYARQLEEDLSLRETELAELKQELVEAKMKLDKLKGNRR